MKNKILIALKSFLTLIYLTFNESRVRIYQWVKHKLFKSPIESIPPIPVRIIFYILFPRMLALKILVKISPVDYLTLNHFDAISIYGVDYTLEFFRSLSKYGIPNDRWFKIKERGGKQIILEQLRKPHPSELKDGFLGYLHESRDNFVKELRPIERQIIEFIGDANPLRVCCEDLLIAYDQAQERLGRAVDIIQWFDYMGRLSCPPPTLEEDKLILADKFIKEMKGGGIFDPR